MDQGHSYEQSERDETARERLAVSGDSSPETAERLTVGERPPEVVA